MGRRLPHQRQVRAATTNIDADQPPLTPINATPTEWHYQLRRGDAMPREAGDILSGSGPDTGGGTRENRDLARLGVTPYCIALFLKEVNEMKDKSSKVDVRREKVPETSVAQRSLPFSALRHEIDRLLDDFAWPDLDLPAMRSRFWPAAIGSRLGADFSVPAIDLVERSGEYEVQAELPGLTPADIEVKVADGSLVIRGKKTAERVEDDENCHVSERSYGSFQRIFGLPPGIDTDKIDARYENGVLHVRLPKSEEARKAERRIDVKAA